uniref:Uncharacterized protein n=1 Tax=Ditylenchus dipsaci TaxID=166011 RepID=A0A915D9V7_9BILA
MSHLACQTLFLQYFPSRNFKMLSYLGFGSASPDDQQQSGAPKEQNASEMKLRTRPYMTRLANATVKHGSGFAQQAGVAMFLYSAIHVGLKFARADDDLNSIAAAAMAGALFRSPYGLRSSLVGSGAALAMVMTWNLGNRESRDRLREMVHLL